jgi:HAE1 family hydrophobic/amphiphilic exporter-1
MKQLRNRLLFSTLGLVLAISNAVLAGDNPSNSVLGNPLSASQTTAERTTEFPMPIITGPRIPPSAQTVIAPKPHTSVSKNRRRMIERRAEIGNTLADQWSAEKDLPSELQPGGLNQNLHDDGQASLTVKEAIFVAMRNNPALRADLLEPLAAQETVRQANATFDPEFTSHIDVNKDVSPAITNFNSVGQATFARKEYNWNFGASKVLSTTNGVLALGFDNSRISSNARAWTINPSYNPSLGISLSQPLLRNFGLDFATINVRIAQAGQARAQYSLEQNLSDFLLQVATDYWNVVRAVENLQVNKGAFRLAQDTVNKDLASLKMGMAARIDVQEAQSVAASWRAAVLAAQSAVATTKVVLRQDVMLNPQDSFLPEGIDPSERPTGTANVDLDEQRSLELAMEYRPELGAMRESLRGMLLQVRFSENQTLPELNFGAQVGMNSTAGSLNCFHFHDVGMPNCTVASPGGPTGGTKVPLGGIYGDALNRMWNFSFYNYAVGLTLRVPLTNDYANATLAQARVEYDQQRLRYREQVSKIIVDVGSARSNLATTAERVRATDAAAEYARAALSAEEARYRAGASDTHELLQYQQLLISSLAFQVQAQLDLEVAKLTMEHAKGTLLKSFQIDFVVDKNYQTPWYARF